eukprot:1100113-Rhodomonas_salina.2
MRMSNTERRRGEKRRSKSVSRADSTRVCSTITTRGLRKQRSRTPQKPRATSQGTPPHLTSRDPRPQPQPPSV